MKAKKTKKPIAPKKSKTSPRPKPRKKAAPAKAPKVTAPASTIRVIRKEDYQKFLGILRILNMYARQDSVTPSPALADRENLVTHPETIQEIHLATTGAHLYLVTVTTTDAVQSWLHVDGIAQERANLKNVTPDHPVFGIICMGDIYDLATPI